VKITDATPHLEFEDSTGSEDDYEFYADGNQFYLSNLTDTELILQLNNDDSSHTPTPNALRIRTGGFICPAGLSTDEDCEEIRPRTPADCSLKSVDLSVTTAPTGAALIVDVNACVTPASCTTLFSSQANRPRIFSGNKEGATGTFNTATLTGHNFLGIDIDQVGSTVAGSDLTVTVSCVF